MTHPVGTSPSGGTGEEQPDVEQPDVEQLDVEPTSGTEAPPAGPVGVEPERPGESAVIEPDTEAAAEPDTEAAAAPDTEAAAAPDTEAAAAPDTEPDTVAVAEREAEPVADEPADAVQAGPEQASEPEPEQAPEPEPEQAPEPEPEPEPEPKRASEPGPEASESVSPPVSPPVNGAGEDVVPATEERGQSTGLLAFVRETAIVLVTALVLSLLIKTFLVQAFFIPSVSMENTLLIGDRVLVSKLSPGPFDLHRGDIVVFKDPGGWLPPEPEQDNGPLRNALRDVFTFVGLLPSDSGEHLIKRVIGTPGDVVECCDDQGRLTVNGEPIDETEYLYPGAPPSSEPFKVTVPADRLWVMGDNRDNSRDSRANRGNGHDGTIPVENVVGRAFVIVWPAGRFDWLTNPSDVFTDVPAP